VEQQQEVVMYEEEENNRNGESAFTQGPPSEPEQSALRMHLLTPKNAKGRRGIMPAAPHDPLRLTQSIVAATRQFAALPPPVPFPPLSYHFINYYFMFIKNNCRHMHVDRNAARLSAGLRRTAT
jgi:hypothetical protein